MLVESTAAVLSWRYGAAELTYSAWSALPAIRWQQTQRQEPLSRSARPPHLSIGTSAKRPRGEKHFQQQRCSRVRAPARTELGTLVGSAAHSGSYPPYRQMECGEQPLQPALQVRAHCAPAFGASARNTNL